jgi:hypothetical protein
MPEQLVRLVNPSPSQTNHSLIANTSLTNHSVTDEVTALREVVAHVHLTVSVLQASQGTDSSPTSLRYPQS